MKKSQQGSVIAICAIAILVCLVSAGVLVSELEKERAARDRLEREAARLQQELESLKESALRARTYTTFSRH